MNRRTSSSADLASAVRSEIKGIVDAASDQITSNLRLEISGVRDEISGVRSDFKGEISGVRADFVKLHQALTDEVHVSIEKVQEEQKKTNEQIGQTNELLRQLLVKLDR